MSTASINSVLARCLVEPHFLDRLAADPAGALSQYDLDRQTRSEFLELDPARIRKLAGFITAVQNNQLWEMLPATRSLLKHFGMEVEIFSRYRETHQNLRSTPGVSREEKIFRFLQFLAAELEASNSPRLHELCNVFLHERLRWQAGCSLTRCPVDSRGPVVEEDRDTSMLYPVFVGWFRVGRFSADPLGIESQVLEGNFAGGSPSGSARLIGYWGDPVTRCVRLLDLDAPSAALLDLVDGRRTVRLIVQEIGHLQEFAIDLPDVWQFLWNASRTGFLRLVSRDIS
jgi:hypothetical protein